MIIRTIKRAGMLPVMTPRLIVSSRSFSNSKYYLQSGPPDTGKLLSNLDMLGQSSTPLNNIDTCTSDGFKFTNGTIIKSPGKENEIVGALLVGSEIFELNLGTTANPRYKIINNFLVEFNLEALNIFSLVHPKPELVVMGLGKKSRVLHESNRKFFSGLGTQIEISNTRTACQNFDLLATERPNRVAAVLLPPNL